MTLLLSADSHNSFMVLSVRGAMMRMKGRRREERGEKQREEKQKREGNTTEGAEHDVTFRNVAKDKNCY